MLLHFFVWLQTADYSSDDESMCKTDKLNNKLHSKSNIEQPIEQLRNWIDKYEEAVTNHYSQELRARLSSIKPNGSVTSGELRTPVKIPISRTKMSLLPSGIKVCLFNYVKKKNYFFRIVLNEMFINVLDVSQ